MFFRKLVSLSILHTNFNPLVKNSESPPIRVLIHDHIQVLKAYRLFCNHSKKGFVQGYLLGVEKRCTRKLSSWCREELYGFGKGYLSSGVQGVDFGGTKSRIREISSGLLGDWM